MDKPLYILIFLLLWSNRIRGGEKEDINGSFSPSTQTTGVRNSLIDKASTSSITKKASIFDPDSESSETVSPPIKSKTLETNTGTVEPSVLNSNAPIPAKDIPDSVSSTSVSPKIARESTRKNTTTLNDTDSDSSETNSPPIKSEETKTKPGAPEIFLPSSVTIKPARDSTTVNTTESDPDSDSTQTRTRARARLNNNDFGTQQPSFHNFESHEFADESSETNTPPFISEAPEINPASTTKAKTATISDPNSESTTSMKIISDSKTESSEVKSTFLKSKTSKTTTVDLRRFPRSSDGERDINERSNTNTVSAEMENPRSTRDERNVERSNPNSENIQSKKDTDTVSPSSNQGTPEVSTATIVSTQQTEKATTVQVPSNPECSGSGNDTIETARTSHTLKLNTFQLEKNSCIKIGTQQTNDSEGCTKATSSPISFYNLTSSTAYEVFIFSYWEMENEKTVYSLASCLLGKTYTC